MKVIVTAARKGGVGKTTLAVGLSDYLSCFKKKRVVLVDLDPQASATAFSLFGDQALLMDAVLSGATSSIFLEGLLTGTATIESGMLRKAGSSTDSDGEGGDYALLCGDIRLKTVEEQVVIGAALSTSSRSIVEQQAAIAGAVEALGRRLKMSLSEFGRVEGIDYVILDTEATFGRVAQIAAVAADLMLVPTIADRLSLSSLDGLLLELENSGRRDVLRRTAVVFSKFQAGYDQQSLIDKVASKELLPRIAGGVKMLDHKLLHKKHISELTPFSFEKKTFRQKYQNASQSVIDCCGEIFDRFLR